MKDGHEDDGKKNPEFLNIMYNEYEWKYITLTIYYELHYFHL